MTTAETQDTIHAIARRIYEGLNAQKVILFGSYATGTARPDSDVDLLVIAETQEKLVQRNARVLKLVRDIKQGLMLSPIVLTPFEVEQRLGIGDQFVEEIIRQGKTL